jgi:hypothetical protein
VWAANTSAKSDGIHRPVNGKVRDSTAVRPMWNARGANTMGWLTAKATSSESTLLKKIFFSACKFDLAVVLYIRRLTNQPRTQLET